jgi:YaiO family outer membrane protein
MRATVAEPAPRGDVRAFARTLVALVTLVTLVACPGRAHADDGLCRAAPAIEPIESTDAMLTAAEALTTPLDRPRARALYLAVLARDPKDEEAAVGLARVDAWDGCLALAERGYREVLARSRSNVDARAGLADVLLWTRRWQEAEVVLDEGLAIAPLSPDLLSRRARVAHWSGDVTAARRYLTEAERVSPIDPEVREARDRVFAGQARLGQRIQIFPEGYDDVSTTDLSVLQRWRRLRFEAGATVVSRHGASRETRSGPLKTTILDGRPSLGAFYHYRGGGWFGGTVAVGAPALALPRTAFGAQTFVPLSRTLSLQGMAAYWRYEDDRDVVILSPAIGVALSESVDITARYWLTSVIVRRADADDTVDHVHSVGLRLGWRPDARLALGLDYTYGVQLERTPSASELLELRSHIFTVLARRLFDRSFGADLALTLERRTSLGTGPDVIGWAAEGGVFVRW